MTPRRSSAKRGGVAAGLFVLAVLGAVAVLAGIGTAANGSSGAAAQQYQYGQKVVICHKTHSAKHPTVTIVVSQSALKAHLKHGDTQGPCASPSKVHGKKHHGGGNPHSTTTTTTTTTTTSTTEHGHGSDHGHGPGSNPGQGHAHGH